jgi:hypothetical protein
MLKHLKHNGKNGSFARVDEADEMSLINDNDEKSLPEMEYLQPNTNSSRPHSLHITETETAL